MAFPGGIKFSMRLKDAKANFFDVKGIRAGVKNGWYVVRSKFGLNVRQHARKIIKVAKLGEVSKPGKPPLAHPTLGISKKGRNNGKARTYRDFIFFSLDQSRDSVVIGGVLLNGGDANNPVPMLLEHGGQAMVNAAPAKYRRLSGGLLVKVSAAVPKHMASYQARPHMQVAFDKTVERMLPQLLLNFAKV